MELSGYGAHAEFYGFSDQTGGGRGSKLYCGRKRRLIPTPDIFLCNRGSALAAAPLRAVCLCGAYVACRCVGLHLMSFTVSCKLVRARYGAGYDLSKWVEGVDYVRRRAFSGERVVFRKGFLDEQGGVSEAAEPAVGEGLDVVVKPVEEASSDLDQVLKTQVLSQDEQISGSGVYECRVVKRFNNQRYVETDTQGVIYVGGKPVKLGQVITVSGGNLVLRKVKSR